MTTTMSTPPRSWGRCEDKIDPEHRDRAAIVYVRQSSRQQVLEHGESTRLQYALADWAVALGWARSRVAVIDDDLGVSAAVADARVGFQKLVTEVTMGRVGIVLGIEMSRLARTGRDWHQLLELCSLAGTLLADPDGVYDPGAYNDRLLLGLKGTMSEAELHLIRQRMLSGKLAKAERGELARRAADRLCAPPLGRGGVRSRRAGPDGGAADLRHLRPAGHAECGAALPGHPWHSAAGAFAFRRGQGRADLAAAEPGDAADHAAQSDLRRVLRLRAPPGRAPPQAARPPQHRPGGPRPRLVAGAVARSAAGLPQRRAVPGQSRPAGGQPAARRGSRRAPGRGGAAGRAAALWTLRRAPDDGALPHPQQPRPRPRLLLRLHHDQLRHRPALPTHRRARPGRLHHRAGARRRRPGGAGGLAGRGRPGRGRAGGPGPAVAPATRACRLRRRPGPAPIPTHRAGEPAGRPGVGTRLGGRPGRGRAAGR